MKLFKKPKSAFFWYDFTVRDKRYRGSTKETNATRAAKIAALKLAKATESNDPLPKKASTLHVFSVRFLEWVDAAPLEPKTKTYYKTGWRLLSKTSLSEMRLDRITADEVEAIRFPESPSNANCALRTLRRMFHRAEDWKLIYKVPQFKLVKEYGRSITLDGEAEKKLLAAAVKCKWRKSIFELFRDIVISMRDTGMRNERELYRMRIEDLDWGKRVIFVPDSKTPEGRRMIPMSNRLFHLLSARCKDRREGWVFLSKRSASGHVTTIGKQFREARMKAGLPQGLVLYSSRHDFGTRILKQTGNLAAVMRTMGHRDVKTALNYQHPELDVVREALNRRNNAALATAR